MPDEDEKPISPAPSQPAESGGDDTPIAGEPTRPVTRDLAPVDGEEIRDVKLDDQPIQGESLRDLREAETGLDRSTDE